MTVSDRDMKLRRALFTPCETRESFAQWIRVFLNLDLPDCTVSEESNSNPLEAAWHLYDLARRNDFGEFNRYMSYAGRGGLKTLSASVLEILMVLHFGRDVAHMAAVLDQSQKSQEYVRDFSQKPIIRDFRVGANLKKVVFVSYHGGNKILTESEFNALKDSEQSGYKRHSNYIQIIICTMAGANSAHVQGMFCVTGDTKLWTTTGDGAKRKRKRITARGLFRRMRGLPNGGRTGGEDMCEVNDPKVEAQLLGWNTDTMSFEFGTVTRGHQSLRECVEIEAEKYKLTCTLDHPLYVEGRGFTQAGELKVGDRVLTVNRAKSVKAPYKIDVLEEEVRPEFKHLRGGDSWEQVVLGSLLGDMGIYRKPGNNACVYENHGLEQRRYMDWKRSIVSNRVRTVDTKPKSGYTGKDLVGFRSGCSPILNQFQNVRTTLEGMERLGALGLAVWYMDDGCAGNGFILSTEGFDKALNEQIRDFLAERFQIETKVEKYSRDGKSWYRIHGGIEAKRRLVEVVEPYIHPDMQYKFDLGTNYGSCPECGSRYWFYKDGNTRKDCGKNQCQYWRHVREGKGSTPTVHYSEIVAITEVGHKWVYDFTVDKTNNFFTNGILSKNCIDEVDVIPRQNIPAYRTAQSIPMPQDGVSPFTLLTSTRKSRIGLVQHEIDTAEQTGLQIKHWNMIDVTEACPPSRHKPEEQKRTYWVNDADVKHISDEEYQAMPPVAQKTFYPVEGFAGCGGCRLFSSCKGRLATHQKSKSKMLKPITTVLGLFRPATPEYITTEYLCRKPDTSGLIYPRLNRAMHCRSAKEIADVISGEPHRVKTKAELLKLLKELGARFVTGMDFGFTHNFAVVTAAIWGQYCFVVDVIERPELELDDKIEVCEHLRELDPEVYGDPEAPADIKTFKRKGFRMRNWNKFKGSVKAGIEIVRTKMYSVGGGATLILLSDDPGVETLFHRLENYSFTTDIIGQFTDTPNEENDDLADALRYLVMNAFAKHGVMKDQPKPMPEPGAVDPMQKIRDQQNNWMSEVVEEALGGGNDADSERPTVRVKKPGFLWDM